MPQARVGGVVAALLALAIALWWKLDVSKIHSVALPKPNSQLISDNLIAATAAPSLHAVPDFAAYSDRQRQDVVNLVDVSRPFVLHECADRRRDRGAAAQKCSKFFHSFQQEVVPACLGEVGVALDFRQQVGRALFRNVNFDMADASGIHVDDFSYKAMTASDFVSGKVSCDHGAFCYTSEPISPGCPQRTNVDFKQLELYQAIINSSAAAACALATDDAPASGHATTTTTTTTTTESLDDPLRALTAAGAAEHFKENVWVGSAGVVALTHYDQVHNFFTQLQGRKRFLLATPSLATKLGVFPRVHPFQRQVCWSRSDPAMRSSSSSSSSFSLDDNVDDDDAVSVAERVAKVFVNQTLQAIRSAGDSHYSPPSPPPLLQPLENSEELFDVTLHPGDTLFLPPFWFHAVFALDNSVSISRSLRSYEVRIIEEMRDLPFPTEPTWPTPQKALIMKVYIDAMVGSAEVQLLVRTRYDMEGCRPHRPHGSSDTSHQANVGTWWTNECQRINATLQARLEPRAAAAVARARQLALEKRSVLHRITDSSIRRLAAFDDLELLVGTELGVENLRHFLEQCFH